MVRFFFLWLLLVTPVKAEEPAQAVITTTVGETCLNSCITGVGTYTAYNDVVLKAEVSGRIENVHFQEGEYAKPQQKLFTIYNKEQQATVKKAAAALKLSKSTLMRKIELNKKGFLSLQLLEEAENQVQADEAALALAEEALAKTEIFAPFAGALSEKKVSKGAFVTEGDPLVRIQDLTPIRLTFHMPQKDIPTMKVGADVIAKTDVYPDKVFEGKIEAIEPSVNEKTRSVTVYATFPNTENLLIPGLYAHAELKATANQASPIVIPEQALVVRPGGMNVYKKVGEKAVLTKITLGTRAADQVEVLSGLQKGDEIVLEGQDKLHDGSLIAATPQS
jgi:membrane fusion protein (multidrug efflux system)